MKPPAWALWAVCIVMFALGADVGVRWHDHHQLTSAPSTHRLGSNYPSLVNFDVFDIRTKGAKCDGATDDTAAINATEAIRAAANGTLYVPPGTCRVASTITAAANANWIGVPGQSILQASGAMQSVASFTGAANVNGITFDANRLANDALDRLSDMNSQYTSVQANNGLVNGFRSTQSTGPASLGSVTQVGSGPAITVSQYIPLMLQIAGTQPCIKIINGATLASGNVTFQLSVDNCATFDTAITQPLSGPAQIGYPVGANFVTSSGVLLTPASGTYVANTTYAFTATSTASLNNYSRFTKCQANNNGVVYATSGVSAGYPGGSFNVVTATGTVATTAASQIVVGTNTHFLTFNAQDGDGMRIKGTGGNDKRFMISVVLDDTHLALDALSTPQFTQSGLDFVVASGAGFGEDPAAGNQLGSTYEQPTANNDATGMRMTGLGGPAIFAPVVHSYAINGICIGTAFAD